MDNNEINEYEELSDDESQYEGSQIDELMTVVIHEDQLSGEVGDDDGDVVDGVFDTASKLAEKVIKRIKGKTVNLRLTTSFGLSDFRSYGQADPKSPYTLEKPDEITANSHWWGECGTRVCLSWTVKAMFGEEVRVAVAWSMHREITGKHDMVAAGIFQTETKAKEILDAMKAHEAGQVGDQRVLAVDVKRDANEASCRNHFVYVECSVKKLSGKTTIVAYIRSPV